MDPRAHAVETLYATAIWLLDGARVLPAADLFRTMVLAAPADERAWLGLGACHEALGQGDFAIALYEHGSAAAPGARCHVARARLLRAAGHLDAADAALDAAEAALDVHQDEDARAILTYERRAS